MAERTHETVREMHDKGVSAREIAEVLRVSHQTVYNWLRLSHDD